MTATNKTQTVTMIDGEAVAVYGDAGERTAVRRTTCGKFAIITCVPKKDGTYRLIKLLETEQHARNYNMKIHG